MKLVCSKQQNLVDDFFVSFEDFIVAGSCHHLEGGKMLSQSFRIHIHIFASFLFL